MSDFNSVYLDRPIELSTTVSIRKIIVDDIYVDEFNLILLPFTYVY